MHNILPIRGQSFSVFFSKPSVLFFYITTNGWWAAPVFIPNAMWISFLFSLEFSLLKWESVKTVCHVCGFSFLCLLIFRLCVQNRALSVSLNECVKGLKILKGLLDGAIWPQNSFSHWISHTQTQARTYVWKYSTFEQRALVFYYSAPPLPYFHIVVNGHYSTSPRWRIGYTREFARTHTRPCTRTVAGDTHTS